MAEVSAEQQSEFLFMQLVMMFQGMAMQNLGKVMNPVTNQVDRNLDQAKNMIDLLGMLETKTKNNLNENEKRLLDHSLYELRMNYIDEMKKETTPASAEEEAPSEQTDTPSESEPVAEDDAKPTEEKGS
jgi:hypothetical protein